jgi:hypothetical protein
MVPTSASAGRVSQLDSVLVRVLVYADQLRAFTLRLLGALARPWLRNRALRVACQGALLAAVSLLLTLLAPLSVLTIGPLLLGVPHLLAALRYPLVRQGLHRRTTSSLLIGACLLGAVIAPRAGWGLAAVVLACGTARAPIEWRMLAAISCSAFGLGLRALGHDADILLAHAHNWIALAFWGAWSRDKRALLPTLLIVTAGLALIFSGLTERLLVRVHALVPRRFELDANTLVTALSPVSDPSWGLRWMLAFAFGQSVHYGVWLRSIPDEDRARPGLRSFVSSYRALVADLGRAPVWVGLLVMTLLCIVASSDATRGWLLYLRLALFHGPLELAVAVVLFLERRAPVRAS